MNESELRKLFRTGCRVMQALGLARRKRQIVSSDVPFGTLRFGPAAGANLSTGSGLILLWCYFFEALKRNRLSCLFFRCVEANRG